MLEKNVKRREKKNITTNYMDKLNNDKNVYFAMTSTTLEAVKVNAINLLQTELGERLMQPQRGLNLRNYLFEQFTDELVLSIQNDIVDVFKLWMPFVEIRDIQINMDENDSIGKNKMNINIVFNITRDPDTLESVQVEIGE